MTLSHTAGYSDVLEAVRERAKKKAVAMARMEVIIHPSRVLVELLAITRRAVIEAHGRLPLCNFTDDESNELYLTFAEDFLHHYRDELEQVRSERASAEEKAEMAKEGICSETCRSHKGRACAVDHRDMSKSAPLPAHLCEECL